MGQGSSRRSLVLVGGSTIGAALVALALLATSGRPLGAQPAVLTQGPEAQQNVEATRAMAREVQAQTALLAGYPLVGTKVDVEVTEAAHLGAVPPEFDTNAGTGKNNFHLRGKLAAFDGNWVGLESKSGSKIWIPRENVSNVYQPASSPASKPAKG